MPESSTAIRTVGPPSDRPQARSTAEPFCPHRFCGEPDRSGWGRAATCACSRCGRTRPATRPARRPARSASSCSRSGHRAPTRWTGSPGWSSAPVDLAPVLVAPDAPGATPAPSAATSATTTSNDRASAGAMLLPPRRDPPRHRRRTLPVAQGHRRKRRLGRRGPRSVRSRACACPRSRPPSTAGSRWSPSWPSAPSSSPAQRCD